MPLGVIHIKCLCVSVTLTPSHPFPLFSLLVVGVNNIILTLNRQQQWQQEAATCNVVGHDMRRRRMSASICTFHAVLSIYPMAINFSLASQFVIVTVLVVVRVVVVVVVVGATKGRLKCRMAIKAAAKFVKGFYVSERRDYNCFMLSFLFLLFLTNYYHK